MLTTPRIIPFSKDDKEDKKHAEIMSALLDYSFEKVVVSKPFEQMVKQALISK